MSDKPRNSLLLSRLIEIAKGGANKSSQPELDRWSSELELKLSGGWENQYFQLLTAQLSIEKAASEPKQQLLDPIPSPEIEEFAIAPNELTPLVHEALSYHDWTYLEEVLRILKSQHRIMHPSVLPTILDRCKTKTELHFLLLQTLGKRSHWLSGLKGEWSWWFDLTSPSIDKVSPGNRLYWALIHYRLKKSDPLPVLGSLNLEERKVYLSNAQKYQNVNNQSIARAYLNARSPIERSLAWQLLLQSPSPERTACKEALREFSLNSIHFKKKEIIWNSSNKIEIKNLPVALSDLNYGQGELLHPLQNIIQLFAPEMIFEHLVLPDDEIIEHLMTQPALQDLYQIIINCATSLNNESSWDEKIITQWIKKYPEGNTTEISLTNLLAAVSYDNTQKIISQLLVVDDTYFMEKLMLIISGIKHYINKDLSIKMIEKIFHLLTLRLSRTDLDNIILALPHLQYQLDPRVNNTVLSHWVEIDFRHPKLSEILWEFRNMIRLRSELLSVLVV